MKKYSSYKDEIYLSALVDCFDGLLPTWTIGLSSNTELVNAMLENGIALLNDSEHPIVHTDRDCHYRWPSWIERMEEAGLTRSMSKKGCLQTTPPAKVYSEGLKMKCSMVSIGKMSP